MGWPKTSIRSLMVAVAVVGFDAAVLARAYNQGRLARAVPDYLLGAGVALLILNGVALGVFATLARRRARGGSTAGLLAMTPSPLMIVGLYVVVMMVAIVSVLFLSSGLF
jgi:uncharacterized membrane protein YidH (DUF202 family)